jgi:hypothetical protein
MGGSVGGGGGENSPVIPGNGGGLCLGDPALLDAATCPAAPELAGIGAWVGCWYMTCPTPGACTTCSCVAVDGGAAWDCDAGASE